MKEFGLRIIIAGALTITVCAGSLIASPATERLFEQVLPLVPAAVSAPQELQVFAGDRIVAIGDSITAKGGYLHYIEQVLARNYPELNDLRIINAGVGGQDAEHLANRFERDVLAKRPTIVIINAGLNDVGLLLKEPQKAQSVLTYRESVDKRWLTTDGVHMKPLGDALLALRALAVPDVKMSATEIVVSRPR